MPKEALELAKLQRDFLHLHRAQHQKVVDQLGLYYGQPMLLMVLFDNRELTQKELAEHLDITPASVAVSVKRMEKAGLLIKKTDPNDLRFNKIRLSDKGRAIAAECANGFRDIDSRCFDDFSSEELCTLKNYYERMIQNLA